MPKRVEFRGKPATLGICKYCGLNLLVTDPDPTNNGAFESVHETPSCTVYDAISSDSSTVILFNSSMIKKVRRTLNTGIMAKYYGESNMGGWITQWHYINPEFERSSTITIQTPGIRVRAGEQINIESPDSGLIIVAAISWTSELPPTTRLYYVAMNEKDE